MRHLIDTTDISVAEVDQILETALDIIANRKKYSEACKGKKLATLFYEPSTRTRLSFTSAMMELGGNVLGFSDAASSSVSKGETVADTVRVIGCFADIIAMRHSKEGAPLVASHYANVPIINAGDGSHAHPTQTLTDLLTIRREKGRLNNLTIGFCGDLKFGRTVHSLIKALSRYTGINVILIAPEELRLPSYIRREVCDKNHVPTREVETMEEVMSELDILYMTRVQKERFRQLHTQPRTSAHRQEGYDNPPPAAACERDHACRRQRSPCRLLPSGGERQVRTYGTHIYVAQVGRRGASHHAHAASGPLARKQRSTLLEPSVHIEQRGCGSPLPQNRGRRSALRIL